MATKKSVYVLSDTDGAKYKLVMQGDVQLLTTKKIKRYLEKATGTAANELHVRFNDLELQDGMNGHDIGLYDGAVMHLTMARSSGHSLTARLNPNAQLSLSKNAPPPSAEPHTQLDSNTSVPSSLLTRSATSGRHTHEVQLSPSTGIAAPALTPSSSHPMSGVRDAETHDAGATFLSGLRSRQSPDVQARLFDTRDGSVSMPRTVVQAIAHPYGEVHDSRSPSHAEGQSQRDRSASLHADDRAEPSSAHRSILHSSIASVEDMEDEIDALREENETLRTMLYEAERRAAAVNSQADRDEDMRQLREQLNEMQAAIEQAREDAVEEAALHFDAKERDMQSQLQRLRQQLERVQLERSQVESNHQEELRALRAERDAACRELETNRENLKRPQAQQEHRTDASVAVLASAALQSLARELGVTSIELDESHTAVIPVDDELNMLVTLDPVTGRLFLYATVLNELPESSPRRLKLYETMLEGALLGKDMSGASVGISKESNLVLMSTWIDVRFCDPAALHAMTQPFCDAVRYWSGIADDIVYA